MTVLAVPLLSLSIKILHRPLFASTTPNCSIQAFSSKGCNISIPYHTIINRLPTLYIVHLETVTLLKPKPTAFILSCKIQDADSLDIEFPEGTFTFHAQWLFDAKCDDGVSRTAVTAYARAAATACIRETRIVGQGIQTFLDVDWNDGTSSHFPALWLRAMAPVVAKSQDSVLRSGLHIPQGWLSADLKVPVIDYAEVFAEREKDCKATAIRILDELMGESTTGIVKIIGLPPPNVDSERDAEANSLVTQVLKKICGSVFQHPRRAPDTTFNVASHHKEGVTRATTLVNYDTSQILLTHCDHAHYQHQAHVQGLYGLEGESENTFVSAVAALNTMREESPELFEQLCRAPMTIGRAVHYHSPPLYQGTVDTPVTMYPGTSRVKKVRWHPHLTGSLVTPFESFHASRLAHRKFQEILRRDSHLLRVNLTPGDLYIWNNFTILHGRERVLEVPRTSIGQTVPEQVVADRYRELKFRQLLGHFEEKWLVHLPTPQLCYLVELVQAQEQQ